MDYIEHIALITLIIYGASTCFVDYFVGGAYRVNSLLALFSLVVAVFATTESIIALLCTLPVYILIQKRL